MTILEVISDELAAPVEPEAVIDQLAIDSLEYIELILRLEKVFSIKIEEEDLKDVVTMRDLCHVVDLLRDKQRAYLSG
jgi:acyl carrier protein